MKILFLCNEYPPTVHGGIGTYTREIAEGVVRAGHEASIWGFYNINSNMTERINGVEVFRKSFLLPNSFFRRLWFVLHFNLKLREFLRERKFDIIECQEWEGLLPFGLNHPGYVVRLHGASVFFDVILRRRGSRLVHYFEKLMLKNAKHLVAVSDYCGYKTLSICGLHRSYKVIYNGVSMRKLSSFKTRTINMNQIVFANSVLPKKGILELASAFNIVAEKYPSASLVIIGKVKAKIKGVSIQEMIFSLIRSEFHNRVLFTGWLEHSSDVYKLLASSHLCCYPSKMEGFGIAPVEAMALGKPVIFMNDGPGPEVIEQNVSGILVDTMNPVSIAEGIVKIFEDEAFTKSLGKEAEKRVLKMFDLETSFIPNNISWYEEIIGVQSLK